MRWASKRSLPVGGELGEVRDPSSPADHVVAVGKRLHAALRRRASVPAAAGTPARAEPCAQPASIAKTRPRLAHFGGGRTFPLSNSVYAAHPACARSRAGRRTCAYFGSLKVLRLPPRRQMILPGPAVDLVDGPRVARRDEEVPVVVERDRVQMRVVDRAAGFRVEARVGVLERDVAEGMPLEQHVAGLDVDLHARSSRPARRSRGPSERPDVPADGAVREHERRSLRGERGTRGCRPGSRSHPSRSRSRDRTSRR